MRVNFIDDLPVKGKLLIIILILVLVSLVLAYLSGGIFLSLLASAVCVVILFISKPIWLPEDYGKTSVRKLSLWLVLALAGSYFSWGPALSKELFPELKKIFPNLELGSNTPSILVLVFAFLVILVVNYFIRDTTAMKQHAVGIDKEFPELDFKKRLQHYSKVIANELNNIDIETNWSDYDFTPIDAEVEIIHGNSMKRKVDDLLIAMKADRRSQVFLVLGDPGSGKSVALRKLAKELLKEVKKTGKIPIYINLKEWEIRSKWTKTNPPTVNSLYDFIVRNLKNRGDYFASDFIDVYFKKMYEHGRIFFLLDSFDEIPSVLDSDEKSWMIDELSDVIYKFLAGAHESRGVLASRIFRRPSGKFKAKTTFEIRPFSEFKIEQTFSRSIQDSNKNLLARLIKDKPELIPVIRNPFMTSLMIRHLKENNLSFPDTQAALYEDYIDSRLDFELCREKIEAARLTKAEIIGFATELSFFLFSSETHGLEIKLNEISGGLSNYNEKKIDSMVEILVFAKIGRMSPNRRFSFVHRRFNEYFVVNYLRSHPEEINLDSIPTDSRWRDALILYCEIADEKNAQKIANYCWSEIKSSLEKNISYSAPQFLRSIHCLRFLAEAFRGRSYLYREFSAELSKTIMTNIEIGKNILLKKYSVEAVGLLDEENIEEAIILAFNSGNSWLAESAFKSSRYLPKIGKRTERKIRIYLMHLYDPISVWVKRKELIFSTSLSDAFINIKRYIRIKVFDAQLFLIGIFLILLLSIKLFFVMIGMWIFINLVEKINKHIRKDEFPDLSVDGLKFFIFRIFSLVAIIVFLTSNYLIYESIWFSLLPVNDIYIASIARSLMGVSLLLIMPFIDLLFPFNSSSFRNPRIFISTDAAISKDLILGIKKMRRRKRITKEDIKFYVAITGVVIGASGIIYWLSLINKKIIESALEILVVAAFILYTGRKSMPIIKEYLLLKRCNKVMHRATSINREYIATNFGKFSISYFREQFILSIQNKKLTMVGEWPRGELPNHNDDLASILLAKLEAKAVGLEV